MKTYQLRDEKIFHPEWYEDHHVWCNFAGYRPASGCSECERLQKLYPQIEGDPYGVALQQKYFPDAIPVGGK
jgi:hypothetical protein